MRKLVAAAICLLSLSLSVTTGRTCIKEARTRTGKKCCEQQLRRVDKALSRAGDIPEGSWICLSHRNLILAEDKRCSMFLQFLAHAQTFDRGVARCKHWSLVFAPVSPSLRLLLRPPLPDIREKKKVPTRPVSITTLTKYIYIRRKLNKRTLR